MPENGANDYDALEDWTKEPPANSTACSKAAVAPSGTLIAAETAVAVVAGSTSVAAAVAVATKGDAVASVGERVAGEWAGTPVEGAPPPLVEPGAAMALFHGARLLPGAGAEADAAAVAVASSSVRAVPTPFPLPFAPCCTH